MDLFQTWKLAIDALLVISLMYLSVRFLKTHRAVNTRELRDLEIVLRTLLRDADVASKSLAESLSRRQSSLEGLLSEISTSEVKLRDLSDRADALKEGLIANVAKAEAFVTREPLAYRAATLERGANISLTRDLEEKPRAVSASSYSKELGAPESSQVSNPSSTRLNIYGEPIQSDSEAAKPRDNSRYPKQPLAQEIEVERAGGAQQRGAYSSRSNIDRIYEAAEAMLRAGKDLESTAAITRLPIEDVRKLSQIVLREQQRPSQRAEQSTSSQAIEVVEESVAQAEDPSKDPRLGVLASIRRQVEVL